MLDPFSRVCCTQWTACTVSSWTATESSCITRLLCYTLLVYFAYIEYSGVKIFVTFFGILDYGLSQKISW